MKFVISIVLVFSTVTFASVGDVTGPFPPTTDCQATVYRISVPLYPDRANSPTYDFAFQLRFSNTSRSMPWVINLPGGPGYPSIGGNMGILPKHYNVIFTDPRGSGCNKYQNGQLFLSDSFTTEYLANDILELLKLAKFTNYYIYGSSFGTVEGTVLTHKIEQTSLIPPKGLVLSGTVSRYFESWEEYVSGIQTEWIRARTFINPMILNYLNAGDFLGYPNSFWAGYISLALANGDVPGKGPKVSLDLNELASSDTAVVQAAVARIKKSMKAMETPYTTSEIGRQLGCRELWRTHKRIAFENGNFATLGEDHCKAAGIALERPFDVRNYPIRSPIWYVQGQNDPLTPYQRAVDDFYAQKTAPRTFIFLLSGAGHGTIEHQLGTLETTAKLWDYLILDPAHIDVGLRQLNWPVVYARFAAGQ